MNSFLKLGIILFLGFLIIASVLMLVVIWKYNQLEKRMVNISKQANFNVDSMQAIKQQEGTQLHELNLLPVPKEVKFRKGLFHLPSSLSFHVEDSLQTWTGEELFRHFKRKAGFTEGGAILGFIRDNSLHDQAYRLSIAPDFIRIHYASAAGIHYALVSLKVLDKNYPEGIPCCDITDWPDLAIRGVLLDISRDKIPTMETLFRTIDLLSDLKYNHLELYIEGFSYEYPGFPELKIPGRTPVTPAEMKELDQYCRDRYIELVPNQNSLGHMSAWLSVQEFRSLAECPDGFTLMGMHRPPGTLDPSDPAGLQLVTRMTDDLLPAFNSSWFNVNLDEPFELGQGKNRKRAEKENGVGSIYLDYVKAMHRMVVSRNHKMMMWADILLKYPSSLDSLPRDISLLDWGYEADYPFARHAAWFRSHQLDFLVCPGTSSWLSFTGRTDNMLENIHQATNAGIQNGARGMLLTDWGDMGHLQYLPASYAGFTAGAAWSWNGSSDIQGALPQFISQYIFCDPTGETGDFVLEAGRYNRFEDYPRMNGTAAAAGLKYGLIDPVYLEALENKQMDFLENWIDTIDKDWKNKLKESFLNRGKPDYKGLLNHLSVLEKNFENLHPGCKDAGLIREEYANSLRMIRLGTQVGEYGWEKQKWNKTQALSFLQSLKELNDSVMSEHTRLWLARNRSGGLEQSLEPFLRLNRQIQHEIQILNHSGLLHWFYRLAAKVKTGIAVWRLH